MRLPILLAGFLSLAACALPPADPSAGQRFVSPREVEVIQLYNLGLSYAKRQRFVDAELTFRQAEYLDPEALSIKVNLATVLEHLELYDEAEQILLKLIERKDPRDQRLSDFKLYSALGHVYGSARRFADARKAYENALVAAIEKPEIPAASVAARSMSAILFTAGDEENGQCYSSLNLVFKPDRDEIIRHTRLLIARGLFDSASQTLNAFRETSRITRDGLLFHLLGQAAFGNADFESAARLETMAADTLLAPDATAADEIELSRLLALRELTKVGKAGPEDETFDDKNRDKLSTLTGEDSIEWVMLYWPARMGEAYYDWMKEAAAADKGWSIKKLFK